VRRDSARPRRCRLTDRRPCSGARPGTSYGRQWWVLLPDARSARVRGASERRIRAAPRSVGTGASEIPVIRVGRRMLVPVPRLLKMLGSATTPRRHLTASQLDFLGADVEAIDVDAMYAEDAKGQICRKRCAERESHGRSVHPGAASLRRIGSPRAAPDLAARVRSGTMAIDRAERIIRAGCRGARGSTRETT